MIVIISFLHKIVRNQSRNAQTKSHSSVLTTKNNLIDKDTFFLIEQYKVLSDQQISHNETFWEKPLLFLTAQSFLFLIIFGADISWWARALASFVSLVFGFLSIQIFERDRLMEITDSEQLNDIEKLLIIQGFKGIQVHQKLSARQFINGEMVASRLERKKKMNYINRVNSYELWKIGMWITTIGSAFVFFITLLYQVDYFQNVFISKIQQNVFVYILLVVSLNLLLFLFENTLKSQPEKDIVKPKIIKLKKCLIAIEIILAFAISLLFFKSYGCITASLNFLTIIFFIVFSFLISSIFNKIKKKWDLLLENKDSVPNDNIESLILAGGEGKRVRSVLKGSLPKFISIKSNNESLLENAILRNNKIANKTTIITSKDYFPIIKNEYEKTSDLIDVYKNIIIEPENMGTGIAILNYITRINKITDNILIIAPSDHVINDTNDYSDTVSLACRLAIDFDKIYIIGIVPTFASTEYGYINTISKNSYKIAEVKKFIEKPSYDVANQMIKNGNCFWNSGIVIARRSVIESEYKTYCNEYYNLFDNRGTNNESDEEIYKKIEYLSFDVAILQKSKKLEAIIASFDWIDVGNPTVLQAAIAEGLCSIEKPKQLTQKD